MSKPKKDTPSLAMLRNRVDAFLDENGLRGDARFYTRDEWRDRGEPYGRDALVTLVIDGSPMYEVMNGYLSVSEGSLFDRFEKMVASLGFHYELGFAWSVHFYHPSIVGA